MLENIEQLLYQLNERPDLIEFDQVIHFIDTHYDYTPVSFTNGEGSSKVVNAAGTNQGSCKIFGFAQLHDFNEQQTLHCFGRYYREDVVLSPDGDDHANIRNFIDNGWSGIKFDDMPLKAR